MLIDDARHITMLSGSMPGFEHLLTLLVNFWNILSIFDSKFCEKDGKLIWMNEDLIDDNGKLLAKKQNYRSSVCLVHDRSEFTIDLLTNAIRSVIEKQDNEENENKIDIPPFLKAFAVGQSRCWAQSAFTAKHSMEEGVDYIIHKDKDGNEKILPVDAKSTGSIQKNTVLSDGLHQFLQIKHHLKMTAENLVTSFVSNVGYFQRYGTNLYGLTGTIGTEDTQILLKDLYKINICFMPTFRKKQLKEVPYVLCNNEEEEWIDKVAEIYQSPFHELK